MNKNNKTFGIAICLFFNLIPVPALAHGGIGSAGIVVYYALMLAGVAAVPLFFWVRLAKRIFHKNKKSVSILAKGTFVFLTLLLISIAAYIVLLIVNPKF